jgi:hypothetical protein
MGLPNEEWRVCFANDGNSPDSSGRGKPRERNATDAFAPPQFAVCVRVRASCMLCACVMCACSVRARMPVCARLRVQCVRRCARRCARRCVPRVCSACSVRLVRHVPEGAVRAERRRRRLHVWRREVSVEGARASAHVPFLRHARTRAHAREHTHASPRTRAHAKTQCVCASIPACAHAWVTHACAQPIDHMHIRMLRRSDLMQL